MVGHIGLVPPEAWASDSLGTRVKIAEEWSATGLKGEEFSNLGDSSSKDGTWKVVAKPRSIFQ